MATRGGRRGESGGVDPGRAKAAAAAVGGVILAPGTVFLRGEFVPGRQPDGNTTLVHGPEGLVVFDTGRHDEHVARVSAYARASGVPVAAIVNSHWHLDHASGNTRLRAEYPQARIYASRAREGAMTSFLAGYRAQLADMVDRQAGSAEELIGFRAEMARIDAGTKLLPDVLITSTNERALAGRVVRLGLALDAVAGGDVWLFDPTTKLLLAGDLVTLPAPLFDTACAERWRSALAELDEVPFETLVPGHGAPMSHAQFRRYRRAFEGLVDCSAGVAEKAACVEGWQRDAGDLVPQADQKQGRMLLDYYVGKVLRGAGGRCGALGGRPLG